MELYCVSEAMMFCLEILKPKHSTFRNKSTNVHYIRYVVRNRSRKKLHKGSRVGKRPARVSEHAIQFD